MTALNFPDSPSNGATYQGYTYDSTKGTWTKPAGPTNARTSVYANIAALPTSGTAGDMAYVTATNRLYLWTGTGWYNIALINNNPTISGVSASYNLAIDGTATTITITATDPEGIPITYSIASDTSGNTATVTQGTGANTNVFTITPSTNTAHAGTFSLTFRASDGVNIASAAASFTLQFSVQNSKYTSSLITSVGANNAVNNSFDDKSASDHTILAGGDACQTTFSPYRHGGYSTYFDGSGDYLGTPNITMLAADQTVEFWAWHEGTDGDGVLGSISDTTFLIGLYDGRPYIWVNGQTLTNISGYTISSGHTATGNTAVSNAWHHYAYDIDVGASTTTLTTYVDGSTYGSLSWSNASLTSRGIGRGLSSGFERYFIGYIADLRIVSSRLYTGAFSPPTERLTAVTNTELLACHLPYFVDGSTNAHTLTPNGNVSTRPLAPYDGQEYSAATHLGSAHFDSSGDYLMAPSATITGQTNSADFNFSSGAWTWEAWVYPNSLTSPASPHVFTSRYNGTHRSSFYYNSSASQLTYWSNGSPRISGPALNVNQWYHVALSSDGTTTTMWVNGESKGTTTHMQSNYDQTMYVGVAVGSGLEAASYWNGNITDARVVKGTQVYTSNFTPPAAPLTAVTNTKLLIQNTDAGIIDKGQSARDLRLFGNTKSSTTQNKFLTSSMYFDGSGDYLKWTNTEAVDWGIGGEPFTLEWWQWWPSIVDSRSVGPQTGGTTAGWNSSSGHQWTMFTYSSSATLFMQWWNGGGRTDYELNHGGALTASTWQHFAIVYDGTNLSNYIDGTRIGHRTSGNTFGTVSTRFAVLGGNTAGTGQSEIYYSDVRITKGLARYSGTSLTVPTAELKG